MTQQVLILGGSGRIGSQVAADLLTHTAVNVTIAGCNPEIGEKACQSLVNSIGETTPQRCQFVSIYLDDLRRLQDTIAQLDLVVHCAGPFHHRNASVLKLCIDSGVNYVDVSDHASFTCKAIALQAEAQAAGITANTVRISIFHFPCGLGNGFAGKG
ncbi:MAG: saccharopine dehydrogenase NADP-binding domain-containing protein [Nostoc sp. DedVER02]|uniref:saccharopine dehydrogenase NADP-binding domain-containing protein n=1 Tax=unclassified Nostoc TaxID=2593658 RepID=UPI002AD5560D|nr:MULTISPECIES: saccharopine dehydrogenase NADP-binding domain-containing protein [unclassified Nostoc]MDZ7987360.1 saccharopine dehydrogenase NADP-binding domain-containing protein [Nostoc sp. DedVER02]MDZ8116041.1 saccharopine dehydrogenase NADP-binding domain-containing protein [Nostoc sp. DedVER01b]